MTHDRIRRTTLSTRSDWEQLADALLRAVKPHTSPEGAAVLLPGPTSASGRWSDGLEGFARTFLLAAFRVLGADGHDPERTLERYARGLAAGTDPTSPERWPTIAERRQAVVEAASISIALSETRPWLWDQLDETVQTRTITWLSGIIGTAGYTNNWIWFQNIIEAFLRSVGGPWSQEDLDRNAQIAEDLYTADGWYSDGAGPTGSRQNFDYYAGWAWHVYPMLHARISGTPLPTTDAERLRAFVPQALELIGSSGAPVLHGRSATYRFAIIAPLWAAALAGVSPLEPGRTRQIGARVVSHFLDRGAAETGLLSVGWHREFPAIRQLYTSGGSTYWASKGLLGLLLPAEHPEWAAEPPASEEHRTGVRSLRAPGWIVSRTADDGIVRVINHGSDGWRFSSSPRTDNPFYHRLGYSNVTSPELSRSAIARPLENHVALLDADGHPSHRDAIVRLHHDDRVAVSRSRVYWCDASDSTAPADAAGSLTMRRGPSLTVASVVNGVHELRLAWWSPAELESPFPPLSEVTDTAWPEDAGPWRFRIGGWALPHEDGDIAETAPATVVRRDALASAVSPVRGLDSAGAERRSGGNPFSSHSTTPWVASAAAVPAGRVVAAVVSLSTQADTLTTQVAVHPDRIHITWSDGAVDTVPTDGSTS